MDILLSTNNKHKVEFIKVATSGLGINFHTPKELGLKLDVEENGKTAVENAKIKAEALSKLSGMPTFAWDMGMCIEKLPEKLQPNLHIRRPFGKEELSDADMVEYWRTTVEKKCEGGQSKAHYFDGVVLMNGNKIIHSASFNEGDFIFTSVKKEEGIPRFNAFDQVRKTLDGKYFCDLSEKENLEYDSARSKHIRDFFKKALEKMSMIYEIGMLCKHFKGANLEEKNIYKILALGVDGKDIDEKITYTGDGELKKAKNLVVYANIFQNNKLFAREYEDISSELSLEKQQQFSQTIKVQPLTEEETELVNDPKFVEIKREKVAEKFNQK